jgi:A/G-specific adenine glycosylase
MASGTLKSPSSVVKLLRRTGELLAASKRSEDGRTQNLNRLVPALLDWFSQNARDLPWRRTRDPYAIWVSEIMLQQTQVKTVIPYWKRWLRELPTVKSAADASPDKIHKLWEGLGYYTRVRNLQKAAKQIMEKHGGNFPRNFEDVLALPGIGRYTAGAICSIAFNQPVPILDGNVIRVLTRVFGIGENPKERQTNARLWRLAEELVIHASRFTHHVSHSKSRTRTKNEDEVSLACSHLNESLMELGALVCTPRNPQCEICPVNKLCIAFRENRVKELPNPGKRVTATARHFVAFVAGQNGRFLVRQRLAGVVNAHLWEFPNVEISGRQFNPKLTAKNILGVAVSGIKPFCTVKHSITRYRITLEAFRVNLRGTSCTSPDPKRAMSRTRITRPSETGIWLTPAEMRGLAFTAAHKKLASLAANRILSG